jgi:hypothetical protein
LDRRVGAVRNDRDPIEASESKRLRVLEGWSEMTGSSKAETEVAVEYARHEDLRDLEVRMRAVESWKDKVSGGYLVASGLIALIGAIIGGMAVKYFGG